MREHRPLDAFVGRDAELEALTRSLDRALGGDPVVALVAGEAGIGKSRLVDALVAAARRRDVRVVWGEARDDRHAPLSLWVAVQRALGSGSGGDSDGASALPSSERRWELVDRLATARADAAPVVVVVVEDLHWADEGSVWALERLPRRLLGQQVLLVGTTRRDEPGAVPLAGVRQQADVVVELEGLDVGAVEHLIDALAMGDSRYAGSRVDAPELVARTGGNPLFLRELLVLGSRGDRMPPAVSDVLARSLARLDLPVQEALAALAVAGDATPLAMLTAALGSTVDDVMTRFEAAAAADVVTLGPAGRPAFRHVLLSEAAVEAVTPAQHAALADAWDVLDTSPAGCARAVTHRLAALPSGDPQAVADAAIAAVRLLVTALADRHLVPDGVAGLAARAAAADEIVALGERLRRPDIALQGYEWRFGDRLDRAAAQRRQRRPRRAGGLRPRHALAQVALVGADPQGDGACRGRRPRRGPGLRRRRGRAGQRRGRRARDPGDGVRRPGHRGAAVGSRPRGTRGAVRAARGGHPAVRRRAVPGADDGPWVLRHRPARAGGRDRAPLRRRSGAPVRVPGGDLAGGRARRDGGRPGPVRPRRPAARGAPALRRPARWPRRWDVWRC